MIIDFHVHVHPNPKGLGARFDASEAAFIGSFDRANVQRAVLMAIEPDIPNEFVKNVAQRRNGAVSWFCSVDLHSTADPIAVLEQALADGASGLLLHPRRQQLTANLHLDSIGRLARHAGERQVPVLIDSFPYGRGALRDKSLELIEAVADSAPETNIVIGHSGGLRILDALILARTSYRIFFDLSLVFSVYRGSHIERDVFYAIRRLGPERCLYGSDFPDWDMAAACRDFRTALDQHGFSEADQEWIFGRTAQHLLRLSEGVNP